MQKKAIFLRFFIDKPGLLLYNYFKFLIVPEVTK